jgi:predicted site-specific integrase-resolvase
MPNPDGVPQLLTLTDLAKRLRLSPHTIRSWVKTGKLIPTRICRRLLFNPTEIARFLATANRTCATTDRFGAIENAWKEK